MTSSPIAHGVTYEEYLVREAISPTKLEYLRGEIFDMAGGTPEHSRLAMRLALAIGPALADRRCELFTADAKVRIGATDLSTYPDLSVVCGALTTSTRDPNAITNPVLLVEVLSPPTEAYDRGAKFDHYRQLESLQEMVFVDFATQRIEVHRRNEAGRFELYVFKANDVVELASVGARFPVAKIYEDRLATSA